MNHLFLQTISPLSLSTTAFTGKDLLEIHALSIRYGLFPLVYDRLRKMSKAAVNHKQINNYLKEKETLYLRNVSRSASQEVSGQRVLSLLAESGITAFVIRGNEIAGELYGDPHIRTSSDIDILVRMSDAVRADSVFSKAGYRRNDRLPLEFWFYRLHHAVYSDPETGDLIEMHWGFSIPSLFELSSEEIWEGVVRTDHGQYRLSPEMNMIMLLAHHHMHTFRELKILVDILWALEKHEKIIHWDSFVLTISKIGLMKSTQIVLHQIQTLWKGQSHESVLTFQHAINNLGYKEQKTLVSYFDIDLGKQYAFQNNRDKFMARFALDSRTRIAFSFIKTLFPVSRVIKALYGDQRFWTLPLNYAKFILWRMKDWTGLGKNAKTPV
jgi:hypothetical protein